MKTAPITKYSAKHIRKFWAKVEKTDGCWVWQGARAGHGHGHMGLSIGRVYAHRMSWELANGPIPDGLNICHKCDNPPCVRPDHLYAGTQKQNCIDRQERRRTPVIKLEAYEVLAVRRLASEGIMSQRAIAHLLHVCQPTISRIVSGKDWAWLS